MLVRTLVLVWIAASVACQSTKKNDSGAMPDSKTAKSATAETAASKHTPKTSTRYARPGFLVYEEDGRLWVFHRGSKAHASFLEKGEPAKRVMKIGAGPGGKTVMGAETETIDSYIAGFKYGQPGFEVYAQEGRLWVFRKGGDAHATFLEKGEPVKRVMKIGVGPEGKTVMGADSEAVDAYVAVFKYGREGFYVQQEDGRLWVFREGSESLAMFHEKGEPAKRVMKIGAGPDGKTVMGAETETIDAYITLVKYGRKGFYVQQEDGRLWVFREGSKSLAMFHEKGEPAKRVMKIGAGPDGKTLMGAETETLDAYMATFE